jgi:hypothetical protein
MRGRYQNSKSMLGSLALWPLWQRNANGGLAVPNRLIGWSQHSVMLAGQRQSWPALSTMLLKSPKCFPSTAAMCRSLRSGTTADSEWIDRIPRQQRTAVTAPEVGSLEAFLRHHREEQQNYQVPLAQGRRRPCSPRGAYPSRSLSQSTWSSRASNGYTPVKLLCNWVVIRHVARCELGPTHGYPR